MFILDLVEVCGSPEIAHLLGIIKRVLNLIQLVGPILGIVGLILALIKLMMNPEDKKTKNSIRNWVIAIFMFFLIDNINHGSILDACSLLDNIISSFSFK